MAGIPLFPLGQPYPSQLVHHLPPLIKSFAKLSLPKLPVKLMPFPTFLFHLSSDIHNLISGIHQ